MEKLRVNLKKEIDDSYIILIEANLFKKIPNDLRSNPVGNKYAIITDSNVRSLYGEELVEGLKGAGLNVCLIDFPAGEDSKSLNTIVYLASKLIENGLDRKSALIALGGGVVSDVAGFIAAIYMRGIPCIQVPTTLMAQVDSSVGGKTAVDLPEGKNLIGSFYQPKRVYIDPTILFTLPEREIRNGLAEVIKHGVIYDRELFEYLENSVEEVKRLYREALTRIIFKSCQIKSEVVEKDEKEENFRSILNYGHTVGHAIEQCGKYKCLHGEAVAIGMNCAGSLAVKKGFWREEELKRQNRLIESFGLPLQSRFDSKELIKAMHYDKKAESGRIMFVLPERIGKMATINGRYRIPISGEELTSVLQDLAC